jgi:hypothetical protein
MNIQTLPYDILFLIWVHKTSLIYTDLEGLGHMTFCESFTHSLLITLDWRGYSKFLIDAYEFQIDSPIR